MSALHLAVEHSEDDGESTDSVKTLLKLHAKVNATNHQVSHSGENLMYVHSSISLMICGADMGAQ